jgi:hypothetical protein
MKKTISMLIVALFTLGIVTCVDAAGPEGGPSSGAYQLDASLGLATGPGDYDSGWGFSIGAGYTLESIDKNLQARLDLSFFDFKHDFSWGSGTYLRVPITIGARYYLPLDPKLRVFGQVGLESSIDNFDTASHESKSELNIGLSPGVGAEFFINPQTSIFAVGIAHLISDDYFSMNFGLATHF